MTECRTPHNPKSRRRALAGIIALFTAAGICAGVAGGMMITYVRALQEMNGIRANYAQSARERANLLNLCLQVAPKAATQAADAADRAAQAATAASNAAGQAYNDEKRIEGEIPQTSSGDNHGKDSAGR